MEPPQPPLPTARNLPFHPVTGSHTSIPISESLVGLSVAATRQKGGRPEISFALLVTLASVMETPGEANFARLSQDCAWAADAMVANRTTVQMIPLSLMIGTISASSWVGIRENRRSLGFARDDKGEGWFFDGEWRSGWWKQQVPPLRFPRLFYLELISRMRAVSALPGNSLKIRKSGESTTLFTIVGLLLLVAFSKIPRRPK